VEFSYKVAHLVQATSPGSVKPWSGPDEARGGSGGESERGRADVLNTAGGNAPPPQTAVDDVVGLNQACRAAGLPRDNSSRLQTTTPAHQSIDQCLKWPKWCNHCKDRLLALRAAHHFY